MATFEYQVRKKPSSNPRSNAWRHGIYIDGQCISSGYCIDMRALVESFEAPGDYFFLTCSCGEPGCAGLSIPFHVAHLGDGIIHWQIEQPEPEREFYFSAGQALHSLVSGLLTRQLHEDLSPSEADFVTRFHRLEFNNLL
jgi:hypothetical protein